MPVAGSPAVAADLVQAGVGGDPVEPGAEVARPAKLRAGAPGPQQRLLQRVLGPLGASCSIRTQWPCSSRRCRSTSAVKAASSPATARVHDRVGDGMRRAFGECGGHRALRVGRCGSGQRPGRGRGRRARQSGSSCGQISATCRSGGQPSSTASSATRSASAAPGTVADQRDPGRVRRRARPRGRRPRPLRRAPRWRASPRRSAPRRRSRATSLVQHQVVGRRRRRWRTAPRGPATAGPAHDVGPVHPGPAPRRRARGAATSATRRAPVSGSVGGRSWHDPRARHPRRRERPMRMAVVHELHHHRAARHRDDGRHGHGERPGTDTGKVLVLPPAPDAIELRHLRAFVAVAEELNFGRAATRLFVSQPALSRQIRGLERLVGCDLLRRSTHRVELTLAGDALLDRARRLLTDLDDAVLRHPLRRRRPGAPAGRGLGTDQRPHRRRAPTCRRCATPASSCTGSSRWPPGISVRPVIAGGVPSLLVSPRPQELARRSCCCTAAAS